MRKLIAVLFLAGLATGCEADPRQTAPATRTPAQQSAALEACIAHTLAANAQESLEALQAFEGIDGPTIATAGAVFEWARAYDQHAQLHYAAFAHADSALNHARTSADSARYIQTGQAFLPRRPEPGTLEENVAAAWIRDFATIHENEDHRCHWDV
jgi:hypothetical protein